MIDFKVCTLVLRAPPADLRIFKSQHWHAYRYLRSLPGRVVDVGAFGEFQLLKRKMRNYDVPDEEVHLLEHNV